MKLSKKHDIELISLLFLGIFLIFILSGGQNVIEELLSIPTLVEFETSIDETFEQVGLSIIFFYEFIPEGFRFIGVSGIYFELIDQDVNHFLLLFVPAIGKIGGEILLYMAGYFIFRRFKSRLLVDAGKAIHKHRIFAFFLVPFGGMLGAFIMIVAGHQKLNLLKILPILMVANIVDVALWLYPVMAQMQVSSLFGG